MIRSLVATVAALLALSGSALADDFIYWPKPIPHYEKAMDEAYTPRVAGQGWDAINDAVNAREYCTDATPGQWSAKAVWNRCGDCEDFALAKIREGEAQGLTNSAFMVVRGRYTGRAHAVVRVTIEGRDYVLDNQLKERVTLEKFLERQEIVYYIETQTGDVFRAI